MRNFILAGHGLISSGLLSSITLIIGKPNNLYTIDAYNEPDFDLQTTFDTLYNQLSGEIIVITDIKGGSVNNFFLHNLSKYNYTVIHTMSLPLMISLLNYDPIVENTEQLLHQVFHEMHMLDNPRFVSKQLTNTIEDDDF